MHGYDMMSGWGGMWFGPLLMIAIIVAVIALIVWLVRMMSGNGARPIARDPTARRLLDERYARGEIDDEEYRRRRAALES